MSITQDQGSKTYKLCEAVFDLTSCWVSCIDRYPDQYLTPEDSREMARLIILWAEEFETKNCDRNWDDGGYMEEIEKWFDAKYEEEFG